MLTPKKDPFPSFNYVKKLLKQTALEVEEEPVIAESKE